VCRGFKSLLRYHPLDKKFTKHLCPNAVAFGALVLQHAVKQYHCVTMGGGNSVQHGMQQFSDAKRPHIGAEAGVISILEWPQSLPSCLWFAPAAFECSRGAR
jgi:hypothetical protein